MTSIDLSEWLADFEGPFPDLFLVGGVVRDLLLGRTPKDVDLACKDAKKFACSLAKGKNMAIVAMEKKPDEPTFRIVDRNDPGRVLDIAELRGSTIDEDLYRRDFTINAIAMKVQKNGQPETIIDPANGKKDIAEKRIRSVSKEVFESDPLRILRAYRFAAQLEFAIDQSTRIEIQAGIALLAQVSAERIVSELLFILNEPSGSKFIRQMDGLGILDIVIPEIIQAKGCTQNHYHHKDVWEHSLLVMENCEYILNHLAEFFGNNDHAVAGNLDKNSRLPLLKLAALLHDVGKPATRDVNPATGRITFYGHDEVGAAIMAGIAERLKLAVRDRDFLRLMVAEHLHVLNLSASDVTPRTLMRWFRDLQDDAIPVIILGMTDLKGTLGPAADENLATAHIDWSKQTVTRYYDGILKQLTHNNLISGKDLMALGMNPGPEIGRILALVREAQDIGEIVDKDAAMSLARSLK